MEGKFIDVTLQAGKVITSFVEKAAGEMELDSVLWYQGNPIWFIEERKETEKQLSVRRVQITSYLLFGSGSFLYFVPQIFVMPKKVNVIKTLKQIEEKNIKRLPLQKFDNVKKSDTGKLYNDFCKKLKKTWEIAMGYSPSKLDESILRIKISSVEGQQIDEKIAEKDRNLYEEPN